MNPYHQSAYLCARERMFCVRCTRGIEPGARFLNYAVRAYWYPVCMACSILVDEHGLVFDCIAVRHRIDEAQRGVEHQ